MVNGIKQWVFHELGWFIGGKIRKQPPILREVGGKNHSRLVVYDRVNPKHGVPVSCQRWLFQVIRTCATHRGQLPRSKTGLGV